MHHWYEIAHEAEIPSPALLVFVERAGENMRQMLAIAGNPLRVRPHIKTHKLPQLVRAQVALGITKCKCATIAEAEMAAEAGARDILLAFPSIGPNANRLVALQCHFPEVTFSTLVDSREALDSISHAAKRAKISVPVYLDLDCGMGRTGIRADSPEAVHLYERISRTSGVTPAGLHAYDGHIHDTDLEVRTARCDAAFEPVLRLRSLLLERDFAVPALVAGGTPTFPIHARHADREVSPGTYILWDFGYGEEMPDLPFEPAAVLLTRVVSKPGPHRLCLDLGHKAVASENPHPRVRILELPDAVPVVHSEEHLVLETSEADHFHVGDVLHGIPRHICPTVNLYNEAWAVYVGSATERWPVVARARRLTV